VVKTVLPFDLAVYYPHPRHALASWPVIASGLLVAAVTGLAWLGARRVPYFPVGWFRYLGTLVPVVGLVQVGDQALADRYTYVPLVGLFVLAGWGLAELSDRLPGAARTSAVAGLCLVALISCSILTWVQQQHWYDGIALWSHAIQVIPPDDRVENNLGGVLMDAGRVDAAI